MNITMILVVLLISVISINFQVNCSPVSRQLAPFPKFRLPFRNCCPKGIYYKQDCNTCSCDLYTGQTVCTQLACTNPVPPDPKPDLCPKGLHFKEDCNICFCDAETGIVGCTKKDCTFHPQPIPPPDKLVCPRGPNYKEECNYCICDLNTGGSVCTRMNCTD